MSGPSTRRPGLPAEAMTENPHEVSNWETVARFLGQMRARPPKALLLEGGDPGQREGAALHWASALNCTGEIKPCGACAACRRIAVRESADLVYLDGREGRIGIGAVRELLPLLGQAPRDGGRRVIVFGEAQEMTTEAANALLKSMEDTDPRNCFVLLVPQRERLLPTLVSRSWVLTLGWPEAGGNTDSLSTGPETAAGGVGEWLHALLGFLRTGRGWFARTMVKSQVDKALASAVIRECRRNLIQAMQQDPRESLARFFHERGDADYWRDVDLRLNEAEQALAAQVAPALVLDWLAAELRSHARPDAAPR